MARAGERSPAQMNGCHAALTGGEQNPAYRRTLPFFGTQRSRRIQRAGFWWSQFLESRSCAVASVERLRRLRSDRSRARRFVSHTGDKVVALTLLLGWVSCCSPVLRKHLHKPRYAFLSQRIWGSNTPPYPDAKYLSRLEKPRYFA